MELREYAQAVADGLNGEVVEVEKPNMVVLTGVQFGDDAQIKPTMYVNEYFKKNVPVEEVIERFKKSAEQNEQCGQIEMVKNLAEDIKVFDRIKTRLKARLYNGKCKADVKRSAAEYGFDDLIIVPYIQLNEEMSAKVTDALIKNWEVSADEVIDIAIENTKDDVTVESLADILRRMGCPVPPDTDDCPLQWVVSNENKAYGAVGILFAGEKLKSIYPEGYVVIPSSVHEVIVMSRNGVDEEFINSTINEVNEGQVMEDERLGTHAYVF